MKKTTVAAEVVRLLTGKTQFSYAKIAEKVRAKVPDAQTSPRSVASIATAARAAGAAIPDRRRHAG